MSGCCLDNCDAEACLCCLDECCVYMLIGLLYTILLTGLIIGIVYYSSKISTYNYYNSRGRSMIDFFPWLDDQW